jgi:hypothetical protein
MHLSLDPTTIDPHAQIQWIRSVLLLDLTVVLTPEMYLRSTAESDFGPSSFGTSGLLTFVGDETPEVNLPE